MSLILARSPYFIERGSFDEGATLTVTIGEGSYSFPSEVIDIFKTYTLNFRQQTELDISPLIRDCINYNPNYDADFIVYVKTTISGDVGGVPSGSLSKRYYATDGYSFYEDGYNLELTDVLANAGYYAGSNTTIYRYDREKIRLPFLSAYRTPGNPISDGSVSFYKDGVLQKTQSIPFRPNTGTYNMYQVVEDAGDFDLERRITDDGGVFVDSSCIRKWIKNTPLVDYDTIIATGEEFNTTLTIKTISECKHQPYEIIFKNRYGVEESLWFFKKSEYSLNTTSEEYRGNTFAQFKAGDLSYHTYQDYNVNGKEMMVLNTGFLEESFSENFKQLGLSEKVYIMKDNVKLPVKLKSRDITYKQSVNEKLIDYRIEVEFAYDKLNNIV